jgi:hypothetical protein
MGLLTNIVVNAHSLATVAVLFVASMVPGLRSKATYLISENQESVRFKTPYYITLFNYCSAFVIAYLVLFSFLLPGMIAVAIIAAFVLLPCAWVLVRAGTPESIVFNIQASVFTRVRGWKSPEVQGTVSSVYRIGLRMSPGRGSTQYFPIICWTSATYSTIGSYTRLSDAQDSVSKLSDKLGLPIVKDVKGNAL